jgi:hypothetical protein
LRRGIRARQGRGPLLANCRLSGYEIIRRTPEGVRRRSRSPGCSVCRAPTWRSLRGDPRWRVLMLRTFDLAVKGAANKSAQGIALGGVGIAVRVTRRPRGAGRVSSDPGVTRRTRGAGRVSSDPGVTRRTRGAGRVSSDPGVTRRARGARRGSPDPAGLPDRQVSRAHRRPRFQRCSCLLSLRQNEGDLSVKHLGGVRRPAPSAGSWAGSGDPRPARARSRVACNEQLRNIKTRQRGSL